MWEQYTLTNRANCKAILIYKAWLQLGVCSRLFTEKVIEWASHGGYFKPSVMNLEFDAILCPRVGVGLIYTDMQKGYFCPGTGF